MTNSLEALIAEMKAAAGNATQGIWCTDSSGGIVADAGLNRNYYVANCSGPEHRSNAKFIAAACPENVLSLIAALEQAQMSNAFLKEQLAQLANFNPDWDKLEACQESWREVSAELKAAQQRVDALENDEVRQRLANAEHQLHMAELAKYNLKTSRRAQFRKRLAAEKRIAELEVACDSNYIDGMKTGWNYCDAGNSDGFNKCVKQRRKGISEAKLKHASRLSVKLPKLPVLGSTAEWYQGFAKGAEGMRKECAEAIRAAGGTVEGE